MDAARSAADNTHPREEGEDAGTHATEGDGTEGDGAGSSRKKGSGAPGEELLSLQNKEAKRKRASKTAKLKQTKLDVRREQWLAQVVATKNGSVVAPQPGNDSGKEGLTSKSISEQEPATTGSRKFDSKNSSCGNGVRKVATQVLDLNTGESLGNCNGVHMCQYNGQGHANPMADATLRNGLEKDFEYACSSAHRSDPPHCGKDDHQVCEGELANTGLSPLSLSLKFLEGTGIATGNEGSDEISESMLKGVQGGASSGKVQVKDAKKDKKLSGGRKVVGKKVVAFAGEHNDLNGIRPDKHAHVVDDVFSTVDGRSNRHVCEEVSDIKGGIQEDVDRQRLETNGSCQHRGAEQAQSGFGRKEKGKKKGSGGSGKELSENAPSGQANGHNHAAESTACTENYNGLGNLTIEERTATSREGSSRASSSWGESGSENEEGSDAEDDWEAAADALTMGAEKVHLRNGKVGHVFRDERDARSDGSKVSTGVGKLLIGNASNAATDGGAAGRVRPGVRFNELAMPVSGGLRKNVFSHQNSFPGTGHHLEFQFEAGALRPEYKYNDVGMGLRSRSINGRAWRPDDVARPQTLPPPSEGKSEGSSMEYMNSTPGGREGWQVGTLVKRTGWGVPPPAPSFCPICTEELDMTDSSFVPCSCGFRLCLFCHHRIASDDGRCPGCRKVYSSEAATKRTPSLWLRV